MKHKIYFIVLLLSLCYKATSQEVLIYQPLDSIVTTCVKEHISFLQKGNFLDKNEPLYFNWNCDYQNNFSPFNQVERKKN